MTHTSHPGDRGDPPAPIRAPAADILRISALAGCANFNNGAARSRRNFIPATGAHGAVACGMGRNGGRGAKAPTMHRLALAPSSASRSKPARILGLKRTPQRMASAARRLCMSARAGEASRWPARWWSAARRCALRETWPSQGYAERGDNDVAPCGAPSPLAFFI